MTDETATLDRAEYDKLVDGFWTLRGLLRELNINAVYRDEELGARIYKALDEHFDVPRPKEEALQEEELSEDDE
jgi:hypothetical protein